MTENICPNCFADTGGYSVCPHCGFCADEDKREVYHLPIGSILKDRYLVGRVLGFGGFGATYKSWDTSLNMAVAVKELYPAGMVTRIPGRKEVSTFSGEKSEQYKHELERFLCEARNTAKFREHPYIVNVFDFFQENNTAYFVMEFLDGVTLKEYVVQNGDKLEYPDVAVIMEPVMFALEELHSKNILHRDLSPDNIFITKDNHVKLIDFGAARFASGEAEETRSIVVKTGYSPPEQYRSRSRQGAYTDVYAVGATIYRLLTGVVPEESIDRLLNDELKKPSALGIKMPLNAEKAIMKAMALKEGLRFQKVSEMRQAFADRRNIDFPEVELKKRRKKRIIAAASIFVVLLLTLSATLFYSLRCRIVPERIAPGELTIWVPVESGNETGNETGAEAGATSTPIDRYAESFMNIDGNEKFNLNIVGVPQAEYENKILEAEKNGTLPDMFDAGTVNRDTTERLSGSTILYYLNFNASDYYSVSENMSALRERRVIPVGFRIPVAYVNAGLLARIGQDVPEQYTSLDDITGYDIKKLTERYDVNNCAVCSEEAIGDASATLGVDEQSLSALQPSGEMSALQLFTSGKAVIYIAYSDELPTLQSSDVIRGSYAVVPLVSQTVYGDYSGSYCISSSASFDEQRLAMLFLSYLSSTSSSGLPLEKESLVKYSETNEQFLGFLAKADEKGKIYADNIHIDVQN